MPMRKQRIILTCKILFLDVLLLTLGEVILVDADQIVRTDLKELIKLDFQEAHMAMPPMATINAHFLFFGAY